MKRKNMISMVTSLALVGVVAVGGTLALLSQQSNSLKNTFAVGNGYADNDFILQEDIVKQNPDGSYVDDEKQGYTQKGQDYKNLVSDTTLHKNPFFTLQNGDSEGANPPASWVVAKLDQADIVAMKNAGISFAADSVSANWYLVTGTEGSDGKWTYTKASEQLDAEDLNGLQADGEKKYYFVYGEIIDADASTELVESTTAPLFTKLSVDKVDETTVATNLDIFGVAVQYVEGATLEANLNQIVGAAAGTLDKAVTDSRAPQQP